MIRAQCNILQTIQTRAAWSIVFKLTACLKAKPNVGSRSINQRSKCDAVSGQRSAGSFNIPVNQTMRTSGDYRRHPVQRRHCTGMSGVISQPVLLFWKGSGLRHRRRDERTQLWWRQSEATWCHWWKWQLQAWIPSVRRFFPFFIYSACRHQTC